MPCRGSSFWLALVALPVELGAVGPPALALDAFSRAAPAANLASLGPGPVVAQRTPQGGVKVAPQWSADSLVSGLIIGFNLTDNVGVWAYDSIGQRQRDTFEARPGVFTPRGTQLIDFLTKNVSGGAPPMNMTVGSGAAGACQPQKGAYFDVLSWTVDARYNGSKIVDGEHCDVWKNERMVPSIIGIGQLMQFSACIAADGVPREFAKWFHDPKGSQTWGLSYRFSNIRLGDPGDVFATSQACESNYPGRPCEDEGVRTVSIYRVWAPPEPMELENRDTGDVMGDLSFLCTQGSGGAFAPKLITHWSVEVSSAFGQYAMCNYDGHVNRCVGEPSMLRRVGRRSSQMIGDTPANGQCSKNTDNGSQYSFPVEARCPEGTSPSVGGCAWATPRPVRTIRVACMLERGLLEACEREFGHAPFRRASAIFEAALASNDTSKGGCPDVHPARTLAAQEEAVTVII